MHRQPITSNAEQITAKRPPPRTMGRRLFSLFDKKRQALCDWQSIKSVERYLSLPNKKNLPESLAEHLLALVIIVEGENKVPLIEGGDVRA